MKSKTNISVVSNTGVRRKSEVIIGDNGTYTSGDILDANATQELINSGGGGAGGDYPSDEQVIHIVADDTYTDGKTYLEPLVNESLSSGIPTYQELKSLINKYKGQVFIDYAVRVIEDSEENAKTVRFLLRYSSLNEQSLMKEIEFTGPAAGVSVVSVVVFANDDVFCNPLQFYSGYFECTVDKVDGAYEANFSSPITAESIELAKENQDSVRCVITDSESNGVLYTTLTKRSDSTYVFSNNYAELTITFTSTPGEEDITFKYFEE